MPLGTVDEQTSSMTAGNAGQFSGLGYDPQKLEGYMNLANRIIETKRKRELEDYASKLKIAKSMESQEPEKPPSLDDLAKTRKSFIDAGLDTSVIDKQIAARGVDTSKKVVSEGDNQAIGIIDELLSRNTKPLTGAFRLGQGKPIFGMDPLGGLNRLVRPELETTKAKVKQLEGLLQLAQSGKLKGTGPISNNERELLAKAATSLSYTMSDEDFQNELRNIKGILSGKKTGGSKLETPEDLINSYW